MLEEKNVTPSCGHLSMHATNERKANFTHTLHAHTEEIIFLIKLNWHKNEQQKKMEKKKYSEHLRNWEIFM